MTTSGSWSGSEFVQRSEAVQQSQRIAVDEIEDRARPFGEQVVGVDVSLSLREGGESAMASMYAVGTAVRRFREHDEIATPKVFLRLSDEPTQEFGRGK
jgi:uncharacterized protein YbjQ (UPF0145 family)